MGKLILINYYTCRKTDHTDWICPQHGNKLDFQNVVVLCSVQGIVSAQCAWLAHQFRLIKGGTAPSLGRALGEPFRGQGPPRSPGECMVNSTLGASVSLLVGERTGAVALVWLTPWRCLPTPACLPVSWLGRALFPQNAAADRARPQFFFYVVSLEYSHVFAVSSSVSCRDSLVLTRSQTGSH